MRHAALDMLALPAKLGVSAALSVALATAAAEFVTPAHGPASAGSPPGLPRSVHDLVLLEDGRYAVIRFPRELAVGEAGSGFTAAVASHPGGLPQALAGPTPEGRILVGDADGDVRSWLPTEAGPQWRTLGSHGGPADMLCLSPDGRRAAAISAAAAGPTNASPASPVTVWDLASEAVISRFVVPGSVDWAGFCGDSERLVARAEDGTISVWQALGGEHLDTVHCGVAGNGSAACSPAGPLVAWCGPAGDGAGRAAIRMLDLSGGGRLWESTIEFGNGAASYYVPRLAFSSDGTMLACGTADAVLLFDASDGRRLAEADAAWHRVTALRFGADGRSVVSAGGDGTVRWWGVPGLSELLQSEDLLPD